MDMNRVKREHHIFTLCEKHDIAIWSLPVVREMYGKRSRHYKFAAAGFSWADCQSNIIYVDRPLGSVLGYVTALHEIAHLIKGHARPNKHPISDRAERRQERQAWKWALKRCARGLSGYSLWRAYRWATYCYLCYLNPTE